MRVIAVIDQREVVERESCASWACGTAASISPPTRAPPDARVGPWIREPCDAVDPTPDYENVLTD